MHGGGVGVLKSGPFFGTGVRNPKGFSTVKSSVEHCLDGEFSLACLAPSGERGALLQSSGGW